MMVGVILSTHAFLFLRDSIVASIPACHAGDWDSIPRRGKHTIIMFSFSSDIVPFRPFSHLHVSPTTATSTYCTYAPKTKDLKQHAYLEYYGFYEMRTYENHKVFLRLFRTLSYFAFLCFY